MAKKVLFYLVFAGVLTGGIFAQDGIFSLGGGGVFGSDFGGGVELTAKDASDWMEASMKMPYIGGGGYIFLDATYWELTFDLYTGFSKYKGTVKSSVAGQESYATDTELTFMNLNVGLFGKYPFALSENFSLFPLLGAEYNACISATDKDGNTLSFADDFSAIWLKAGCGMDIAPTEKFFLRFEALYGLRFANNWENDYKEAFNILLKGSGLDGDTKTLLGNGLTVRIAVGYKL
jgi:uncharacterized protein YfiM (DUF2279 family)